MKKIFFIIIFLLFLITIFITKTNYNAYVIKDNFDEPTIPVETKTQYRTYWASWWNRWNYHYYKDIYTVSNNGVPKRILLKKANITTFYQPKFYSYEFQYQTSASISKQYATTISINEQFVTSFSKMEQFITSLGFSYTESMSLSIEELKQYKFSLKANSPEGYYALYFAVTAYEYFFNTYFRDQEDQEWEKYVSDSKVYSFTTDKPYFYVRYEKNSF